MKKLLFAIFIFMFVSIIGCEVPYTGPLLSVNDVTQFLRSKGEDTVCVQDGFDSVCLKVVVRKVERQGDTILAPVIHIHPTGVMYEFYYEGRLVLRAERSMDTTEIAEALVAAGIAELPADSALLGGDNGVDVDNAFEGWRIQMYYPEAFAEVSRGDTLETSGFEIRIVEGTRLFPNTEKYLEITNFTQIDEPDGVRIAQFDVGTDATKILVRVRGLVPGYIAKFRLNIDGIASDEGDDTFELQRIR
ncbi:hypothetical protein F4Y59_13240 [Candidatus Poribacteria bacterium]|nr:hypothetical protein [Candidatus Poribacteria bacterium]MXY29108.1 hypothetical protein [Candidatus Poribacteria bacterium]MYK16934.1 hypothetical protein [Candidatus Poribacteria bacterium]